MEEIYRIIYYIEGIIQGVGFRPSIYCYAVDSGIGGWIRNCSDKVELAVEGTEEELELFIENLDKHFPEHAEVERIKFFSKEPVSVKSNFRICRSEADSAVKISIPADLGMCRDCEREILDPDDRRYGYAFTTCVNCGPRYTVVNSMPYDRCRTTLNKFPLCPECEKEYTDPGNRRFHAESTACPVCGPELWISGPDSNEIKTESPVLYTVEKLSEGRVAAIRGIGGYLLAVDAFNPEALKLLRKRKERPDKPFAVMAKNIDVVEKYCYITGKAKNMMVSQVAPIVILDVKKNLITTLKYLSPDTDTLGVMLPYTPLHKLIFENSEFEFLVMTSGNRGGEPICIKNEEAFKRLKGIADFFLCHNREINLRNDDSLSVVQENNIQVWRRARGLAPNSLKLNFNSCENILAMGAELKNTISLLSENEVVLSPHIGDLETPEAVDGLKQVARCFPEFLNRKPEVIAVDKHPDMHSVKIGKGIARNENLPLTNIQHHHAHAVSCMAENGLNKALAIVFDGTGLGDDGNIWGGELLYTDIKNYKRLASFDYTSLPGGDAAVFHPVRQLAARLISAGIEPDKNFFDFFNITASEYEIWKLQIKKGINSPLTSAAGRLFDSFSSLLNIAPDKITYEGQSAIRLETYARRAADKKYIPEVFRYDTYLKGKLFCVKWDNLFREFYNRRIWDLTVEAKEKTALSFHKTVSHAALKMVKHAGEEFQEVKDVVLSGGVFMNRILTALVEEELGRLNYNVNIHSKVPPNDGGISLGQAVIAAKQRI